MPRLMALLLIFAILIGASTACRERNTAIVTIALDQNFGNSLDFLTASSVPANAERLRSLMFNTLVKKNEKYEYIGDLAKEIKDLDGGATISFTLQDNVKFHNGKALTGSDVKYTFDNLLKSGGAKAASFFDNKQPQILSVDAPDAQTVNFKLARVALKNQLLSNLVAIPIIPEGSLEQQKASPVGTGPYKFVSMDSGGNTVDLVAFNDYWEGAPKIQNLRVKVVADQNAVQAELKSQRVDVAPMMVNLPPDTIETLGTDPALKIEKFNGANVQVLTINTQSKPLDDVRVRQAIAYAIDRAKIIQDLLRGQGKIANSILPEESWAYSPGTEYSFDQAKARQLLDEAGFKPDAKGNRFPQPIKFKISAGTSAISQYAQVIQNQLQEVGIPVEIEPVEFTTLQTQWQLGQFQMTMNRWVGGNQDPIFLKDLFLSTESTDVKPSARNRSRYKNAELDRILEQAVNETDREKSKPLYNQAQAIISRDVPALPLWYAANVVVANKRIDNFQVNGSGDWSFVRNLTVSK